MDFIVGSWMVETDGFHNDEKLRLRLGLVIPGLGARVSFTRRWKQYGECWEWTTADKVDAAYLDEYEGILDGLVLTHPTLYIFADELGIEREGVSDGTHT